ncbi:USP6 N-terminal-like protein [Hypsizygus marmoreus]|uniref:USP6 N-terminal-like protein n=1 Tax=Hypsizygus marmoreus TaxID=39966 RepID=A0A369K4V6_HYPMA|nr:USP6 N-terminal-like protein [Hypsizygus marmoreus]
MLKPQAHDQGPNVATRTIKPAKEMKLRRRVYKGISNPWHAAAWDLMMTRNSKLGVRDEAARHGVPGCAGQTLDVRYPDRLGRPTDGQHIMFRTRCGAGQRFLFHVLHCFSLRCGAHGYAQGMGPIAATLLCYFEPGRACASLVRLHDAHSLHTAFSPRFPGLLEAIYVQERIAELMMPETYDISGIAQLRLRDTFLLEERDAFVAAAVAIAWVHRDQITSAMASFETALSILSSFFVPEDEGALLTWIGGMLGDKKLRSSMLKWKTDWKALVGSGKGGAALL